MDQTLFMTSVKVSSMRSSIYHTYSNEAEKDENNMCKSETEEHI